MKQCRSVPSLPFRFVYKLLRQRKIIAWGYLDQMTSKASPTSQVTEPQLSLSYLGRQSLCPWSSAKLTGSLGGRNNDGLTSPWVHSTEITTSAVQLPSASLCQEPAFLSGGGGSCSCFCCDHSCLQDYSFSCPGADKWELKMKMEFKYTCY